MGAEVIINISDLNMLLGAVAVWGPMLIQGVMLIATGLALAEAIGMAMAADMRGAFFREFRRALPWAAGLVAAQLAAFSLALVDSDFKMLGRVALMMLLFAVLFPAIWAVGQVWGGRAGMLSRAGRWSERRVVLVIGAVAVAGFALNLIIVTVADVQVGENLKDMTKGISPLGMGMLAIWLMINAPWQEELLMRHYLVARVAALRPEGDWRSRRWTFGAVVLAAVIFAVGHGGHMEPAWPKLLQTFAWGLMLGWARVWLGTWYAVALHLVWNLSSPLVVPFIR